ncbi:hypothetical protein RJT34_15946 [Clitoria ternatea]|uniref:Uncharacterized protein n=1 Tax=Clitoria ternatea TaxID=43366 RepID=A0AAN9J6C1_CLITE
MHKQYDEEFDSGEDQAVIIVNPKNKKALGITSDVIRIHEVVRRKKSFWKRGQKIKVLKGACTGCHKTTIYATIEYFLLEGVEGDTGGEARIICRPMDIPNENGCSLSVQGEDASLDIRSSLSLPISVIDSGKLVAVESIDWENRLTMKQNKSPASTGLLGSNHVRPPPGFDRVDSNCKGFQKTLTVKPSYHAGKYEVLSDEQKQPLDVRVGFTFQTIHIACYDAYDNRAAFQSVPDVNVNLHINKDMHIEVHGAKVTLSTDKLTLEIKDAMVLCNELDKIRPSYKATLTIASRNVPFSLSIPCRVYPGFLSRVDLKPKVKEDQLHPGFIFKELLLEVDDKGMVDLGGLLKLTAGYGENASISVSFGNKTIFKQAFSTVRKNLRIASAVPDFCVAGGHLENIEFEIVNSDGDIDTKFHHNENEGQFHLLTIKSDFFNTEDFIRYTLKHGRCTIPSIPIPANGGTFCFEAAHSQYTELCLAVEIPVIKMPTMNYDFQPPSSDKSIMLLQEHPSFNPLTNDKEFSDICRLGEKIKEIENRLSQFNEQKTETEQVMSKLLEKIQPCQIGNVYSCTKEEVMTKIKSMENSAASILCSLSRHRKQQDYLMEDIIGVVALIGTVQRPELSRVLAEYLGEDKMLGVICRTFGAASSLERYKQNGEVDCEGGLHTAATALGKAIRNRFLVLSLEDIRPYTGCLEVNDSQRKLALAYPRIPNGGTPDGFMGYAVNMVDLNIDFLHTKTASGHGLRETVLFSLFKKLQVYKTRQSMVAARACIEDGAVSLDGGILRENGILSLGYGDPFISFPCENNIVLSPEAEEILTQIEEMKSDLREIEEHIRVLSKFQEKCLKKFKRKEERYSKLLDGMEAEPMEQLLEYKTDTNDRCP